MIVSEGPIFDLMPKPNKGNDMPKLFTTHDKVYINLHLSDIDENSPSESDLAMKSLKDRRNELASRERKIRREKREFIKKFVDLYYYYLESKNIDRNRSFCKIKLGPYVMKRFVKITNPSNNNHRLTVRNGKKLLFQISDSWYNNFSEFRIIKLDTSAIYELQEVHNLLVDLINDELKIKEEALDELDLTNLSLKELI